MDNFLKSTGSELELGTHLQAVQETGKILVSNLFHCILTVVADNTVQPQYWFPRAAGSPWGSVFWAHGRISLTSASIHLHRAFSSVSLLSSFLFSSLLRTLVIGFRAYPNPGHSHLKLITSAKTLFANKVTFTGSNWTCLLRGHHSAHYRPHPKIHIHSTCKIHSTHPNIPKGLKLLQHQLKNLKYHLSWEWVRLRVSPTQRQNSAPPSMNLETRKQVACF